MTIADYEKFINQTLNKGGSISSAQFFFEKDNTGAPLEDIRLHNYRLKLAEKHGLVVPNSHTHKRWCRRRPPSMQKSPSGISPDFHTDTGAGIFPFGAGPVATATITPAIVAATP